MLGRPLTLTRELIGNLPELVHRFTYLSDVADFLGCSRRTLTRWHKHGLEVRDRIEQLALNEPDTPVEITEKESLYLDFCLALRKARVVLRADLKERLRAGDPGWQSAAWELERIMPSQYGRHRGMDAEEQYVRREIKKKARERIAASIQAPAREPGE